MTARDRKHVDLLERQRSATNPPENLDLTPEPCECHGETYCEDDK